MSGKRCCHMPGSSRRRPEKMRRPYPPDISPSSGPILNACSPRLMRAPPSARRDRSARRLPRGRRSGGLRLPSAGTHAITGPRRVSVLASRRFSAWRPRFRSLALVPLYTWLYEHRLITFPLSGVAGFLAALGDRRVRLLLDASCVASHRLDVGDAFRSPLGRTIEFSRRDPARRNRLHFIRVAAVLPR